MVPFFIYFLALSFLFRGSIASLIRHDSCRVTCNDQAIPQDKKSCLQTACGERADREGDKAEEIGKAKGG
jgi:hypothetical protein